MFLAAVGERMTDVAGEVADGVIVHVFTTERYVREVTMPTMEPGLAAGDRARDEFEMSGPIFIVTGATDEGMRAGGDATRQIASTADAAYRPVLDLHGWGEMGDEAQHDVEARSGWRWPT